MQSRRLDDLVGRWYEDFRFAVFDDAHDLRRFLLAEAVIVLLLAAAFAQRTLHSIFPPCALIEKS